MGEAQPVRIFVVAALSEKQTESGLWSGWRMKSVAARNSDEAVGRALRSLEASEPGIELKGPGFIEVTHEDIDGMREDYLNAEASNG